MMVSTRDRLALAVSIAASMGGSAWAEELPIELQPTTVVTAAGYEQNIAEAPASISVITREQLETQSYRDVTDAVRVMTEMLAGASAMFCSWPGQIEEFLMQFNGEGIQHVAFLTDDLIKTWDALKARGTTFMTAPPDTYYQMLEGRLPNHGEPVDELKSRGILLDGTSEGGERRLLLQIFSATLLGPVFFEFIQRKGDSGFGEGNFKALFESIERDQIERGVLSTAE